MFATFVGSALRHFGQLADFIVGAGCEENVNRMGKGREHL
jgi:hypothetical protein